MTEEKCAYCGRPATANVIEKKMNNRIFKFCSESCKKDFVKNMADEKRITKEREKVELRCLEREIGFKAKQLEKGIIETRFVNQLPGQPALIIEGFEGQLKPKFLIENDIDRLNQRLKEAKNRIKELGDEDETS